MANGSALERDLGYMIATQTNRMVRDSRSFAGAKASQTR